MDGRKQGESDAERERRMRRDGDDGAPGCSIPQYHGAIRIGTICPRVRE